MLKSVAVAALLLAAQTQSAASQCIPRAEAGRMAVALVPGLIDALTQRCAAQLPPGAFLGNGSRALAERIRRETAAIRPAAVAAILGMTGQTTQATAQDGEQMIAVLTGGFVEGIDASSCRGASEMLEALSPLPTPNIGQAFAAAFGVAAAHSSGEDAPPICRE